MRREAWLAASAPLVILAACGGSQGLVNARPDRADPKPPTTAAPVSTTTVAPTTTSPPTTARATAASWEDVTANLVGLDSTCGNLSFVSARPDRDLLVVGVAAQGLVAAPSEAESWWPLGRGPGSAIIDNRTTSLVYDPADPARFWQSGSYGTGAFETVDDGSTFRPLGAVRHTDLVSIDFTDPLRRTLLAGSHEGREVWRSTDGGATWFDVSPGLPSDSGFSSFPHVLDARTHLLGTQSGAGAGIFRTTDGGVTWALARAGGVSGAPVVGPDGSISWLLEDGRGLVRSADSGITWTVRAPQGPARSANLVLLPDGSLATNGWDHVLVLGVGSDRWSPFGPPLPFRPAGITYSPFRKAFYVWRFDCDLSVPRNPVTPGSVMRLDVDTGP